jgi:hypothetical protein
VLKTTVDFAKTNYGLAFSCKKKWIITIFARNGNKMVTNDNRFLQINS